MRIWKTKQRRTAKSAGTVLLGAVVFALLCWCGGVAVHSAAGAQKRADSNTVEIDNFSFSPMELTIKAGAQVTWINRDDVPHTVVSVGKKFKSRALDTGEEFSYTFAEPGTYEYFCSVHPVMTGKIIVK
jgi:amicyanin